MAPYNIYNDSFTSHCTDLIGRIKHLSVAGPTVAQLEVFLSSSYMYLYVVSHFRCFIMIIMIMKGSQQRGTLVHLILFREKREIFWQFSKYVDYFCKNEQDNI